MVAQAGQALAWPVSDDAGIPTPVWAITNERRNSVIAFLVVIGDRCYVTSMIQKLPAITLLEGMFPELSTNQLKVCVFYAMGVPYDAIAQNCRLSPETVRTYLKRSLKNLNLEGYDALRSAVLMRTFVFMISNTAKENEKM